MRIFEIGFGKKSTLINTSAKEEKIQQIATLITSECSEAIAAVKATMMPLYRGFTDEEEMDRAVFKGRSRNDRETHSDVDLVENFNFSFKLNGFKTDRTNSIACSANQAQAEMFGSIYYIFPKNGFTFLWSTKIEDFGQYFFDLFQHNEKPSSEINAKFYRRFNVDPATLALDYGFTDKDFMAALKSGNEINITGEYYAVSKDTFLGHKIFNAIFGIQQ